LQSCKTLAHRIELGKNARRVAHRVRDGALREASRLDVSVDHMQALMPGKFE
jgi:hypothetical protein